MIRDIRPGLGTQLRLLLAQLDGELTEVYKAEGHQFRPRFHPVFQLLLESKEASISEVANHLQASQPAATQTLAEMRRLDLVSYVAGCDRRERIVKLSPCGIELAKRLRPTWDAVRRAAVQLDDELSYPLSAILDEALIALRHKSFPDRIAECRSSPGE